MPGAVSLHVLVVKAVVGPAQTQGGRAQVPPPIGEAEMFGAIFHIPNPQLQGPSPAASW